MPAWVRGVLAGALYGAGMFAWSRLQPNPGSTSAAIVTDLLGGIFFGLIMGLVIGRQERRTFQVDGRLLDADQRLAVRRALVQGQVPDDPLVRDAAVNMAKRQLGRANSPIAIVALVVVFGALAGWLALSGEPLWWLGVVFWIGMGTVSLYRQSRNRQRAHRLLQAVNGATVAAEPQS